VKLHWAILLTIATVVTAVAWPAGAGRIALVLVAIVAGAVAVPALVDLAKRFPRQPFADRFRDEGPARVAPEKPNQLQVLERAVEATAASHVISFPVREQLRLSARHRLLDRHRLNADRRDDHRQIAALVSPELWSIVSPPQDAAGRPQPPRSIQAALLPRLITEIEQL
jgi:hypothetical protein